MIVRFKKLHPDAVIPKYMKNGDCGLDLTATTSYKDKDGNFCYGTGLAVEIPEGFAGLLYPRSSLSKYDLTLCNHVGVVDVNYRGEIILKFKKTKWTPKIYITGDRVAQLIITPYLAVSPIEVFELGETERGSKGFGSSN